MIIKFKNGYTVRVNDSDNRDTKDIIKRAYLLTEEIRINDVQVKDYDYIYENPTTGNKVKLSSLIDKFNSFVNVSKHSPRSLDFQTIDHLVNFMNKIITDANSKLSQYANATSDRALRELTTIKGEFYKLDNAFSQLTSAIRNIDRARYNKYKQAESNLDKIVTASTNAQKSVEKSLGLESAVDPEQKLTFRTGQGASVKLTKDKVISAFNDLKSYDFEFDEKGVEGILSRMSKALSENLENNFSSYNFRNEKTKLYKKELLEVAQEFVNQVSNNAGIVNKLEGTSGDLYSSIYKAYNDSKQFLASDIADDWKKEISTPEAKEEIKEEIKEEAKKPEAPKAVEAQKEPENKENIEGFNVNKPTPNEQKEIDKKRETMLKKHLKENPESETAKKELNKVKQAPKEISEEDKEENRNTARMVLQSVRKKNISLEEGNKRIEKLGYKIIVNKNDPEDPYRLRELNAKEENQIEFDPLLENYLSDAIGGATYENMYKLYTLGQQKDKHKNKVDMNAVNDGMNAIKTQVFDGLKKIKADCENYAMALAGEIKRPVYNMRAISEEKYNEFVKTVEMAKKAYVALAYTREHVTGSGRDLQEGNVVLGEARKDLHDIVIRIGR